MAGQVPTPAAQERLPQLLDGSHDGPQPPSPVLGRLAVLLIAAGGLVLALAGMRAASGILGPTLLGLVIVVTVYPLPRRMRAAGAPAWLAVVVTMLVSYGIILVLVLGTLAAIAAFVTAMPDYADEFSALQDDLMAWLATLGITTADVEGALEGLSPGQIGSAATSALGSVGSVLTALVLMLTVTFFIVLDSAGFPQRFTVIEHARPELAGAFSEFARGTRTYLFVATVFGGIVALADVAILYALGIPDPWVWGLLAFLTGYIPNVGFVIGLIPVAVLALLGGGWSDLVIVIAAYSVVNFVLQSLFQPKIVGDSVGLATTVTFLSLAFWTFILGPIGTILAVPLTLLAKAMLLSADPSLTWATALISSTAGHRDPVLAAAEELTDDPVRGPDERA
jgi:predicted PurR-regulated permease PerM